MLKEISLHRITDISVEIPQYDYNWIELTVRNTNDEKFEFTMFLGEGQKKTTVYEFLHKLRDSVEQAIKEHLDAEHSKSDD
jgi:hypothetical protein